MGVFETIFRKPKADLKAEGYFKMLNGYTPVFSNAPESIYEMELTRAAIHSFASFASKLKPEISGTAQKNLERTLQFKPTFDNGSEFMDCAGIEKSVYGKDRKRTKVYYCHPYSAYERGTNENINKMIRRFLPKGTDFRKVTAAYIQRVETWINNYPREILGFETSGSLFERYVAEAA